MKNKITILGATRKWVNEFFNAIPSALLERAYYGESGNFGNDVEELTPMPKKYVCDECREEFSKDFYEYLADENIHGEKICPLCFEKEKEEDVEFDIDDCTSYIVCEDDEDRREYGLPMWGWLWNPSDSIDEWWIKENLQIVADCGFRIYETDEVGIFLGIDGAGYDFYESHWIPLYKARGLKWHNIEEE